MKRILIGLSLLLATPAWAVPTRVAVVTSDDLEVYTAPVRSFLQQMEKNGEHVRVIHLRGRASEAEAAASLLRREDPDVVFALGAKAAFAVKGSLPSTPLIYASISDPARYGIEGPQVTGIRIAAAPSMYLSQLVGLFPEVGTVGVLHGTGTSKERVGAIKAAAAEVGLQLVFHSADSPRALRKSLPDLTQEVDAVWLVPDREVLTAEVFRTTVEETRRRGLPLLVDTDNMVRAGGLFAVVPDPDTVGSQAASTAMELLGGKAPSLLEIQDPESTLVVLNIGAVDEAGLSIDPLLLDFVDIKID
ncbi:MAG: hypothetical protein KC912_05145 [Proteobacteria bacterium]|nr:hypothetical protein [Pseudomonadota bacterium]